MQVLIIADEMFVGLALPERNDFRRQPFVNLVRRKRFPGMQDFAQRVAGHRPDNDVRVIGHDDPRAQLVTLALEETNCASDEVREFGITQVTDAVTCIEVFVHAAGIPAEHFLLLVPRQGAFGGQRLLEDGVAFLLQTQKDFLGSVPACRNVTK